MHILNYAQAYFRIIFGQEEQSGGAGTLYEICHRHKNMMTKPEDSNLKSWPCYELANFRSIDFLFLVCLVFVFLFVVLFCLLFCFLKRKGYVQDCKMLLFGKVE